MRTFSVATALTVYGIETTEVDKGAGDFPRKLQQHLPFTVLKRYREFRLLATYRSLQQHLPFTVLKQGIL